MKRDILTKIIKKAINNGYNAGYSGTFSDKEKLDLIIEKALFHSWRDVFLSHDFAKTFWGEEPLYCTSCRRTHYSHTDCDAGDNGRYKAWQYHLQQMVLEKDPSDYLAKFIE